MRLGTFLAVILTICAVAGTVYISGHEVDSPGNPVDESASELPVRIFASGRVEGRSEEIELFSVVHGQIAEVLVFPGQRVRAGEVLMRVDDRQQRHELALAKAKLDGSCAALERLLNTPSAAEIEEVEALYAVKLAEKSGLMARWERVSQLQQRNAASRQLADDVQHQLESITAQAASVRARWTHMKTLPRTDDVNVAKARVRAAVAKQDLAHLALGQTELASPCDATVLRVNVQAGELPSLRPSIVIVDDTEKYIRAFVEELDAPRLQLGMRASVTADGLPDTRLNGKIAWLSPTMGPKEIWTNRPTERSDVMMREVLVTLKGNQEKYLVVGLRVNVLIESDS